MPVFRPEFFSPALGRVGMEIILGMGFVVVDVSRRVVVPFKKFAVAMQHFPDHVGVGFAEQAVAFQNLIARTGHFFQLGGA